MYCKYCGSQIPDQSHFCRYYRNQLIQPISHIDIDNIEQLWADNTEASTKTTKKENPPAFQNHAPYSGKFERKEDNTADTATRKKILSGIHSLVTFLVVLLLLSYTTNPDNNLLNIRDSLGHSILAGFIKPIAGSNFVQGLG